MLNSVKNGNQWNGCFLIVLFNITSFHNLLFSCPTNPSSHWILECDYSKQTGPETVLSLTGDSCIVLALHIHRCWSQIYLSSACFWFALLIFSRVNPNIVHSLNISVWRHTCWLVFYTRSWCIFSICCQHSRIHIQPPLLSAPSRPMCSSARGITAGSYFSCCVQPPNWLHSSSLIQ